MYPFSVSSQKKDFIFGLWTCGLIEIGDVLGEALPLGVVLRSCSLAVIFFGDQAEIGG
jgi:hypothetical protein